MKKHEYCITIDGSLLCNQFYWNHLMEILEEIKIRHAPKSMALPEIVVMEKGESQEDQERTKKTGIRYFELTPKSQVITSTGKVIDAEATKVSGTVLKPSNIRKGTLDEITVKIDPEFAAPVAWNTDMIDIPEQVSNFMSGQFKDAWEFRNKQVQSPKYPQDVELSNEVSNFIATEFDRNGRLPSIFELTPALSQLEELESAYRTVKFRKMVTMGMIENVFLLEESQPGYVHLNFLLQPTNRIEMRELWDRMVQYYYTPASLLAESTVSKKFFSTYIIYSIIMECANRYGFFPSRDFLVNTYLRMVNERLSMNSESAPNVLLSDGNFKIKIGTDHPSAHVKNILNMLSAMGILEKMSIPIKCHSCWYELSDRKYGAIHGRGECDHSISRMEDMSSGGEEF